MPLADEELPCPECNGEGIDMDGIEDCECCGGTGVLSAADVEAYREEEERMQREGPIL